MATRVVMPQLGESVVEGTVLKWLINEGDRVEEMQNILEIETDKVTTEIPSPAGGLLLKQLVAEGITVRAGVTIAWIGEPGENLPEDPAPPEQGGHFPSPEHSRGLQPAEQAALNTPTSGRDQKLGFISPLVARLAGEHNVDLNQINGSGEGGRITKKDVLAFIDSRKSQGEQNSEIPAWEIPGSGDLFKPSEGFSAEKHSSPVQQLPLRSTADDALVPLSVIQKTTAAHMVLSKQNAAHVTTVMEADMQRVIQHRLNVLAAYEREGLHLTYSAYFAAAVISALHAFPLVNSSWANDAILQHKDINLGLAVAMPDDSLIVPVIHQAQRLSLHGLAESISDLAFKARNRRLKPDDVQGGTFTISNHGTAGSLFATPIINQPQAAILGVGMIKKRPVVVDGDAIAIHAMVYLSLSFDHRILNGSNADGFLAKIVNVLENWQ
ncbi:MAG: 2-oxo acid dehydrogenase subunit E2 [Anaerolineae bacterium]|nr:2-oxo acid dehydrogenase subunit E2 [Anaerolineae bacterium]